MWLFEKRVASFDYSQLVGRRTSRHSGRNVKRAIGPARTRRGPPSPPRHQLVTPGHRSSRETRAARRNKRCLWHRLQSIGQDPTCRIACRHGPSLHTGGKSHPVYVKEIAGWIATGPSKIGLSDAASSGSTGLLCRPPINLSWPARWRATPNQEDGPSRPDELSGTHPRPTCTPRPLIPFPMPGEEPEEWLTEVDRTATTATRPA